ncbi:MAG TPA: nucleoside hydrolase [Streptosporangiaceae bacterium]|nr:nucleoside hydrolase [Streptosporangiaceae bacterium]
MPEKIILDCDPGVDDALAIVYALASPELDLVGITTVAGNVGLDKTTANALRLREFLNAGGLPVTAGSAAPLVRPPSSAPHVHGEDGLGGAPLPPAAASPEPGFGPDFIVDTVMAAPGEVTLVATGPLTNVALALRREPALADSVRDFVIMGGSSARGNVTPAAEFNIATDPEAAAAVFAAGWMVTMVGLDVTLQAVTTGQVLTRLSGLGPLSDQLVVPCLRGYGDSVHAANGALGAPGSGKPVHDVCAVAHVARPDLIGYRPARVEVETAGRWTAGMTVTDFAAPPEACNALVAVRIDVGAFWDNVADVFARAAAAL